MTTARDIMSTDPECVYIYDDLVTAAGRMRDLGIGSLPICSHDNRLVGMVTDRDIVVRCIADGADPYNTAVSVLADGKPVTIGPEDTVEEALRVMTEHSVRRLPVVDGHALVGMLSQADVAQHVSESAAGTLVAEISAAPSNN